MRGAPAAPFFALGSASLYCLVKVTSQSRMPVLLPVQTVALKRPLVYLDPLPSYEDIELKVL
jgi:hypothetical protein